MKFRLEFFEEFCCHLPHRQNSHQIKCRRIIKEKEVHSTSPVRIFSEEQMAVVFLKTVVRIPKVTETFRKPSGFFPRNSWISTRIPNNLLKKWPNLILILQNMPNSNCHLYHTLASLSEMPIQLKLAILSTFWLGNDYLKIEMVLYPWQEVSWLVNLKRYLFRSYISEKPIWEFNVILLPIAN